MIKYGLKSLGFWKTDIRCLYDWITKNSKLQVTWTTLFMISGLSIWQRRISLTNCLGIMENHQIMLPFLSAGHLRKPMPMAAYRYSYNQLQICSGIRDSNPWQSAWKLRFTTLNNLKTGYISPQLDYCCKVILCFILMKTRRAEFHVLARGWM